MKIDVKVLVTVLLMVAFYALVVGLTPANAPDYSHETPLHTGAHR